MGNFYFGNIRKAGYYPAPSSGMDAGSYGQTDQLDYWNGGSYVAQGSGTHRQFAMEWRINDKTALSWLNDYRSGNYGTGLLYFIDPFALNPVPPHWGTPMLSGMGWPSLVGGNVKPTLVPTTYTRVNLYADPLPTTLTGFSTQTGGATWAQSVQPTGGSDGTSWYRMLSSTANTTSPVGFNMTAAGTSATPVTGGVTHTTSLWITSSVTMSTVRIHLQYYTAAGAAVGSEIQSPVFNYATANTWQRVFFTHSAPATAAFVRPMIRVSTSANAFPSGSTLGASNIMVERSAFLGSWINGTAPAPATQYDVPYQSAQYSVTGSIGVAPSRKLTMLIPPDGDLRIGFTGSATNAGIYLQLVNLDGTITAPQVMPMLSAGDNQLTNIYLPGYLYKAAFFYLAPSAIGGGTVTLASVDARYGTGTSTDPIFGNYVSGDGHSGMRFNTNVDMTYIRADTSGDKQVSVATGFTEIGAWL